MIGALAVGANRPCPPSGRAHIKPYAPPALGYASLVLVARRADGSARVLLNPQPFRDARTGEVVTSVSAGHEVAVAEVASNGELTLLV